MPPATANTSYIHLGSYYYEPIDGAFHLDELTPVEGISPRYPEQAKMTAYSGERIGLPLSFTPGNASRGQISWTSKSKTDRIIRLNYELTSFHKEVLENLNSIHGAFSFPASVRSRPAGVQFFASKQPQICRLLPLKMENDGAILFIRLFFEV